MAFARGETRFRLPSGDRLWRILRPVPSTARVPTICATCQAKRFLEVGQVLADQQLKWFERFACDCGHGFETGGLGLPAPGLRSAILKQSGHGEGWLDDRKAVPKVVMLLVEAFGLTEAAAKARLATLPAVAFNGTHAEVEFIAGMLRENGVVLRVVNHLPKK